MGGVALAIIALLSPFYCTLYISADEVSTKVYTLFWTILAKYPNLIRIDFNVFWVILGYLPFVVLRLGLPIQFLRYYEKKTSGYGLIIAGIAGEIPPLMMILGMPSSFLSHIAFPLPFHLLVCALIVVLNPVNNNEDAFHEHASLGSNDDVSN